MDKIKNINDQTDHSQVKETEKKKKRYSTWRGGKEASISKEAFLWNGPRINKTSTKMNKEKAGEKHCTEN